MSKSSSEDMFAAAALKFPLARDELVNKYGIDKGGKILRIRKQHDPHLIVSVLSGSKVVRYEYLDPKDIVREL